MVRNDALETDGWEAFKVITHVGDEDPKLKGPWLTVHYRKKKDQSSRPATVAEDKLPPQGGATTCCFAWWKR